MNIKTIKPYFMLNTLLVEDKKANESELKKSQNILLPNYFATMEPGVVKMIHFPERKKRTRLVVKKGTENISMLLDNIVLFYTENKIVYAIDHARKKYIAEGNLSALENELDSSIFFRANRQYIININHVKSFRAYEKVKLKVDMNPSELNDKYYIIISQETTPAFKKWIYAA
jgi:DNA-binding LytR/AlgR family response regulator